MSTALDTFKQRLSSGLNRSSIKSCSRWAEEYRVMGKPFPGPYSFKYHPWTRDMHDTEHEFNVGMKAAQMGFTETVLNVCFYNIDILHKDILYVLPNAKPDAANFSASRFDSALDLSAHLRLLFSDVRNVGHKRAGAANMFIRGSGSRTGLKSISTAVIVLDELEEMCQENIPLAFERASGQLEMDRLVWMLSTPQLFKDGIHKYFLESTQDHYFFCCPHCGRQTELIYPECLVVVGEDENDTRIGESHYRCKECKHKLEQETKTEWLNKGIWIPSYTDRSMRGFHISQMYSMTISPSNLAKTHFKALKDPAQEQEFWNSKIGVPHEVKGARVMDQEIVKCTGEYRNWDKNSVFPRGDLVTMGVDVGKQLHVIITDWSVGPPNASEDINTCAKSKIIFAGTLEHFEDLDKLMQGFGVRHCVIDANPERRKADEFAQRFYGNVSLCFYGNNVKGKSISHNVEANTITVDRTSWLDVSLGRFRNCLTYIPCDIGEEFKEHIKAQVRIYEKDRDGNSIAKYKSTGDDHYGHAWNYNEIALPMAFNRGSNRTISSRMV